ncbi:MAG: beta-glucosidase [Chloroflexi bacterium]|nr:beta-glucosidase [Chloroflexota bacterium]
MAQEKGKITFPADFLWGTATSSYQIEGGALSDGRGECIWTRFSHTPGKTKNGDTGDVACDHYQRYRQDVALMRDIGVQAYRYSISWPRILPQGTGALNEAGLDFYDRLTDELLHNDIQPYVTLYHWDLPQALEDQGGWANPAIVDWFAHYADVVSQRLGDRVTAWMTLNEPWCSAMLGYLLGIHAPGMRDPRRAYLAAHYLLRAHGAAVPLLRRNSPQSRLGIALNLIPQYPASDKPEDVRTARYFDGFFNRWYLDPVFKGVYPEDMLADGMISAALQGVDVSTIRQAAAPIDFLGINYYTHNTIAYDPENPQQPRQVRPAGARFTEMGWEINGQEMANTLLRVQREYAPKAMYITENGAAFADVAANGGMVEDPQRVDFLKEYLTATHAALRGGAALKGYFVWSLMDNFEWGEGYSKRFGLVYVDYPTQQRTLKRSAHFYREVIRASGF